MARQKNEVQGRYVLRIKVWKDGDEKGACDGAMTTDSLRVARDEFRSRIRSLVKPCTISPAEMRPIVEDGYVVAAGPITPLLDRMAMLLIDTQCPRENPPMNAFTFTGDGWRLERFTAN